MKTPLVLSLLLLASPLAHADCPDLAGTYLLPAAAPRALADFSRTATCASIRIEQDSCDGVTLTLDDGGVIAQTPIDGRYSAVACVFGDACLSQSERAGWTRQGDQLVLRTLVWRRDGTFKIKRTIDYRLSLQPDGLALSIRDDFQRHSPNPLVIAHEVFGAVFEGRWPEGWSTEKSRIALQRAPL